MAMQSVCPPNFDSPSDWLPYMNRYLQWSSGRRSKSRRPCVDSFVLCARLPLWIMNSDGVRANEHEEQHQR